MAVFSLPYGSQRHKASAGIPSSSAKPPVSSTRQRRSSSKQRRALKQLTAVSILKHGSVWKYFAPLKPWRSLTFLLTAIKRKNQQDELMAPSWAWFYFLFSTFFFCNLIIVSNGFVLLTYILFLIVILLLTHLLHTKHSHFYLVLICVWKVCAIICQFPKHFHILMGSS